MLHYLVTSLCKYHTVQHPQTVEKLKSKKKVNRAKSQKDKNLKSKKMESKKLKKTQIKKRREKFTARPYSAPHMHLGLTVGLIRPSWQKYTKVRI